MNYEIELQRSNVTPAKFFAEIRFACKKKGIEFNLDLDEFASPSHTYNASYFVIGDKKIGYCGGTRYEDDADKAACKSEVCRVLPYDYQTFVLNFDGYCFNEICEFTFDDEKRGHGYYYTKSHGPEKEESK